MAANKFGDCFYNYKILTNKFDYASIKWCTIEPPKTVGSIIIRFDLNDDVDPPSIETLHDIGIWVYNENENIKGIYFYALKGDRLMNLYAFKNQNQFIKDFQSNHFEASVFYTRIECKNDYYYLMTKGKDCSHYRTLKIYLDSEQTDSLENQFTRLIGMNAPTKLKLKEIGKFDFQNYPYLFGKWNLTGNIYLAELKCRNETILNKILNFCDSGSQRILFKNGNNFNTGIISFKDMETAEFNFVRQISQEESILLPESINIQKEEIFAHDVSIIQFMNKNNQHGIFKGCFDYANSLLVKVVINNF